MLLSSSYEELSAKPVKGCLSRTRTYNTQAFANRSSNWAMRQWRLYGGLNPDSQPWQGCVLANYTIEPNITRQNKFKLSIFPKNIVLIHIKICCVCLYGTPDEIRTRVTGVKGQPPRPLEDEGILKKERSFESANYISFPNFYTAFQSICSSGCGFGDLGEFRHLIFGLRGRFPCF